jgi:hypothetical protein
LDDDKLLLVASLDLSSAFDVANIDLLIKHLRIVGMPLDMVDLVTVWLNNRFHNVSIDGTNNILFDLLLGAVQGSILCPFLFDMFSAQLFDLELFLAFAGDSFISRLEWCLAKLIKNMEKSLEAITNWSRHSGLMVNQDETEICLF